MNKQRGFTLIELVVVIIILGVLSAVAVPKFIDLSTDAKNAAAKGVAGSISSGTSINFAAKAAGNLSAVTLGQANVCTATLLQPFVSGITLVAATPTGDSQFLVSGTGDCTGTSTTTVSCSVTASAGAAQPAAVFCAR